MRRLYILPKSVWQGAVQVGVSFKEGKPEPGPPARAGVARDGRGETAGAGVVPGRVGEPGSPAGAGVARDGVGEPVMVPFVALLHPVIGSHCIDLPGGYLLMCTSVDHEERSEDLVHGHPEVAILPHPTIEGNKQLKRHIGAEGYKFEQKHFDALKTEERLGFAETDTVIDLFRKAGAVHPLMKLRNVL